MTIEKIIKDLISFESISEKENLPLLKYISTYLKKYNIDSKILNKQKNRANLYARIGPDKIGGIMLSGHTDVVPVIGQSWITNPFKLVKKNNKLFARGTADMKSFIGVVLFLVPKMVKANLRKPIHLMFSYDEEIGCVGIQEAIPFLKKMKKKPDSCIVGEPTEMKVITQHKGKKNFLVTFNGMEAHSAQINKGVNSIKYASRFINYLSDLETKLKKKKFTDAAFSPPYATINIGTILGGLALNIIPKKCSLEFEIRDLPILNSDTIIKEIKEYLHGKLEKEMKKENKKCSIDFVVTNNFPPLKTDLKNDIVNKSLHFLNSNSTGAVSFGTEAGVFNSVGIKTIVCGPGRIDEAHKPNEFISISQINKCKRFLEKIIQSLC